MTTYRTTRQIPDSITCMLPKRGLTALRWMENHEDTPENRTTYIQYRIGQSKSCGRTRYYNRMLAETVREADMLFPSGAAKSSSDWNNAIGYIFVFAMFVMAIFAK